MKQILLILSSLLVFKVVAQQTYNDSLEQVRKAHQLELLDSSRKVFNQEEINRISSLDYFPISTSNIVKATFKKKIGKPFDLPTSAGKTKPYRAYGKLTFEWNGEKIELTVYQDINLTMKPAYKDYLIIMFRDLTSGQTTYGAGRYMEFRIPSSKEVTLDFNTAYNPYCAFSDRFMCPIPPVQNHLKVAIEAGEKLPIIVDTILSE